MSIKQNGGVFGRNPTFNDVTIEGDLIINGEVFTGLDFQGSWNASTNTPALASSTGTNGEFYIVSVAGTTDLNGITNWGIGDWAIFNGTAWQRVEGGADGNFNDLTANSLTVNSGTTNTVATFTSTDAGAGIQLTDPTGSAKVEASGVNLRVSVDDDAAVANSAIQFRVDGGTKATIDANGNVSILNGNLDVTGELDVTNTAARAAYIRSTTTGSRMHFLDATTTSVTTVGVGAEGNNLVLHGGGAEVLRGLSSGDVSIPNGNLDVTGTATMDGLTVQTTNGLNAVLESANSYQYLQFKNNVETNNYLGFVEDDFSVTAANKKYLQVDGNGDISFYEDTGTTAKLFWDASAESLGIGTSSPANTTHVKTDTDGNGITIQRNSTTAGTYGQLGFIQSTNDAGAPNLFIRGYRGSSFSDNFMTFGTGGSGAGIERMRLDASGNLLVASTSAANSTAGFRAYSGGNGAFTSSATSLSLNRLSSDGEILAFQKDTATVGNISVTDSATAYNTSSDYRLKEDWQPMSGATDRLKELKPVNFAWKSDGSRVDGFLAHEAQEVVPESVTGSKDAMQTEEYEVSPATGDIYTPEVVAVEGVEAVEYVAPVEAQEAVMGERQKMETVETGTYVNLSGETITETQEVGVTEDVVQTVVERQDIDGVITEVEVEKTVSVPVMESYEVSPAVEAVEGVEAVEAVAAVEGVAEVIHSANVEQPSELEDGQLWRETTAQVMGEREVPDYQGIDQAKLVPLLVATIQELEARITALES